MYIQHDPFAFLSRRFSLCMIPLHLDPFGLECASVSPPLPPFLASNLVNAVVSKLSNDRVRSLEDACLGHSNFVDLDPARTWHPLRRESLNVFDCVMGSIVEELANEIDALMVGDVGGRLLAKGLSINVLWMSVRNLRS